MNNALDSRLSLTFNIGFDEKGDLKFQTRNFQNVKPSASDAEVYQTAIALSSLTMFELDKVERHNMYELNA
ncbi:DUF1659 domain-containing protein [Salipaludibacillus sp. CF4.18]|uniref:DUF1659 domain-containing protein n=1 Tax=Salipaludibacillus sp. CF4.18 TaxID=3373081 RepID=UPI003EE47EF0